MRNKIDNLKLLISQIPPLDLKFKHGVLTEYELLVVTIEKLNEVVDLSNITREEFLTIKEWINSQLEEYSTEQLELWRTDGTLESLVGQFFDSKLDKVEYQQDVLNLEQDILNLEQDLRDQITGGDTVIKTQLAQTATKVVDTALFSENMTGLLNTRKHERKALFTIISDDGSSSDYTKLKPIIESKNVPVGLGIVTNWVGTSGYMTWEQIAEMESIGCEIMSHTHTHPDLATLTEDQVLFQMKESKRILNEKGYLASGFVYPYNSTSLVSRKILPKYYTHGFAKVGMDGGGIEGYNLNMRNYEIGRNALGSYFDMTRTGFPVDTTSYNYYKALVDDAFATKNLLAIVLHPAATDSIQFNHLENIIDYIRSNGGEIVSPSEAFNIYGNIIEIVQGSNELILKADGTIDGTLVPVEMKLTNSVTGTELATAFKQKRRTFTPINNSHALANGFPENKGGVLITTRVSSDYFTNFQEYFTTLGMKKRYIRYANSDYTWGKFESPPQDVIQYTAPNLYNLSESWASFPQNKIIYTTISSSHATTNGFPSNLSGQLVTHKVSTEHWVGKQEYIVSPTTSGEVQEKIWVRHVKSDLTWTTWQIVT